MTEQSKQTADGLGLTIDKMNKLILLVNATMSGNVQAAAKQISTSVHDLSSLSKLSADSAQTPSAAVDEQKAPMHEIIHSTQGLAKMSANLQQLV